MSETNLPPVQCPQCGKITRSDFVKTAMWKEERMFVVEDIPAQVCDSCREQFYDEETTDMLRRFTEDGTPFAELEYEILVPVYKLKRPTKVAALAADP